jgi:hypothetical protein
MNGQPGWRFCHKCFGMFFNGDPERKGRCPAGDRHDAQGFVFYLPHDAPGAGQPDWRFCDKCFGMFFNGHATNKGRCPSGGAHNAQGFLFFLPHDVPATAGQPGWRFCDKCFGMFFNGDPANKGRCTAGGAHNAQGFLFVLPHRLFPKPQIAIRAIVSGQRFIEVNGSGFEPSQRVLLNCQFRLSPSGTFGQASPRTASSDAAGAFVDRFPLNSDISFAKVGAFDFGSGATTDASIES